MQWKVKIKNMLRHLKFSDLPPELLFIRLQSNVNCMSTKLMHFSTKLLLCLDYLHSVILTEQ